MKNPFEGFKSEEAVARDKVRSALKALSSEELASASFVPIRKFSSAGYEGQEEDGRPERTITYSGLRVGSHELWLNSYTIEGGPGNNVALDHRDLSPDTQQRKMLEFAEEERQKLLKK